MSSHNEYITTCGIHKFFFEKDVAKIGITYVRIFKTSDQFFENISKVTNIQ